MRLCDRLRLSRLPQTADFVLDWVDSGPQASTCLRSWPSAETIWCSRRSARRGQGLQCQRHWHPLAARSVLASFGPSVPGGCSPPLVPAGCSQAVSRGGGQYQLVTHELLVVPTVRTRRCAEFQSQTEAHGALVSPSRGADSWAGGRAESPSARRCNLCPAIQRRGMSPSSHKPYPRVQSYYKPDCQLSNRSESKRRHLAHFCRPYRRPASESAVLAPAARLKSETGQFPRPNT